VLMVLGISSLGTSRLDDRKLSYCTTLLLVLDQLDWNSSVWEFCADDAGNYPGLGNSSLDDHQNYPTAVL